MYTNQQGRLTAQDNRHPNNIQRQLQTAQQFQGEPKVGQFLTPKRTNKVALFDLILSPNRRSSAGPSLIGNSSGSSIGGNVGGMSQHTSGRGDFGVVARQGILNDRLYLSSSGEVNGMSSSASSNMFASNFYDQQRR
jgi:predicted lipid-binding transport protein (Tim44 family)